MRRPLSGKPARRAALFATILLPTLAACSLTTGTVAPTKPDLSAVRVPAGTDAAPAAPAACLAFRPIGWSVKDTPATIAGVKEHNKVWTALCGTSEAAK